MIYHIVELEEYFHLKLVEIVDPDDQEFEKEEEYEIDEEGLSIGRQKKSDINIPHKRISG